MMRWRRTATLPELTSFTNVRENLHTDEWEFLRSYSISPNDPRMFEVTAIGEEGLLFYDSNFIRELTIDGLYVSTTTKIVPDINDAKYLTIVMAAMNGYAFPIIWIISTEYSAQIVRKIVLEIKNILNDADATFNAIFADSYFELQDLISYHFREIHKKVTSFDSYCKVLRAIAYRLLNDEKSETNEVIKKIMTLSLLPHEKIVPEFEKIRENVSENIANDLREFFTHYEEKWIGHLKPYKFSVFQEIDAINDIGEIYQRVMLNKLGSQRPNFWKFIGFISENLSKSFKDCRKIQESSNIRLNYTSRINHSINNRRSSVTSGIKKLWQLLLEDRIDASEFLVRAQVVLKEFYNDMFFDQYILPEELTIVSIDIDAELDLLLSPPRPWLFENNDYDPENDDDDDDGIERPVLYRSTSVLEEMKRIINEFQPPDEDDEDIDVNNEYNVRCTRCEIALVTAVNLPCKHVEMCNNCASRRINNCCAVCQEFITRTERIFLPTDPEGDGYSLRCEICYSNVASIMWTTCNHGLLFKRCAVQVATQDGLGLTTTSKIRCPHCNLEVEGMVEFKLMKHTENN